MNLAVNRADDHESLFVVVFPVVKKFHGKRVFEHVLRQLKADSAFGEVFLSFGLIPFESQIHLLRVTSSSVKRQGALIGTRSLSMRKIQYAETAAVMCFSVWPLTMPSSPKIGRSPASKTFASA
jgi:hypothetical protein